MAYTTDDLATIEAAIAAGEMNIRLGDMSITYRSIGELIQARDVIKAALAEQTTPARAYPRHQLADFSDED